VLLSYRIGNEDAGLKPLCPALYNILQYVMSNQFSICAIYSFTANLYCSCQRSTNVLKTLADATKTVTASKQQSNTTAACVRTVITETASNAPVRKINFYLTVHC